MIDFNIVQFSLLNKYYISAFLLFVNYHISAQQEVPCRYLVEFDNNFDYEPIFHSAPKDTNKYIYKDSFNSSNKGVNYTSWRYAKPQLSQLAIERRKKQNIKIDGTDYFVLPEYIDSISKYPIQLIRTSRWLNSALVVITDTNIVHQIRKLKFVKTVSYLGKLPDDLTPATFDPGNISTKTEEYNGFQRAYYDKEHTHPRKQGFAYDQLKMLYDTLVDEIPFQKIDFPIAVIDAGFRNVNLLHCFSHLFTNKLLQGTYDFSSNDTSVFDDDDHGTKVLSCLAAFDQGNYTGSASNAKYWLLRSEESSSETLAEEVLWCLAAEWADSVGCILISSSLGYNYFDDAEHSHRYEDMNGEHTIIAKALNMAASKGITIVTSSGNEGDKQWHYITTPGDSKYALTLGACDKKGEQAYYSSMGPSSDGRIKPDIVTLGYETVVCSPMGNYTQANGSSFSTPLMAGFVAHLKQDFPLIADSVLFDAIKFSAGNAATPNNKIGYGIPNYLKARKLLQLYLASNFKEIIWELDKSENLEIRKLNDSECQKIILKMGTQIIAESNVQASGHVFETFKVPLSKRLKKGKKYTLEFIDRNKKTLLMSNIIVHQ